MSEIVSIAVDVMTAEQGLRVMLHAVVACLRDSSGVHVHIVGNKILIEEIFESSYRSEWRSLPLTVHHTDIEILQTDDPVWVLRNKRGSSTHLAVDLVASGVAQAVVSCANTGALGAISRFRLKRMSGVDKLALLGSFPTYQSAKDVYICDAGASFDSSPRQLVQQAKMASAVVRSQNNGNQPIVAILNMGSEASKGNAVTKETAQLLKEDPTIRFSGSIEGHDLFLGHVDIVVCDGFVGNCLLKACEGTAHYILRTIKRACLVNTITRVVGSLLKPVLKKHAPSLNPSLRNGALLMGLNGVVIKSHGNADIIGLQTAISAAVNTVRGDYYTRLVKAPSLSQEA